MPRADMPRYIWERRYAHGPEAIVLDTHANGHALRNEIARCDNYLDAERIVRLLNDEEVLKAARRDLFALAHTHAMVNGELVELVDG